MKNRIGVLALVAGTAVSATAFAQEAGPLPFGGEVRVQPIGFPEPGGYESRAIETVYDNLTNTFGNGSSTHLGTSEMIIEDIMFAPGPWASSTGRLITEITWGSAVLTTPTAGEDYLLIFWDRDDVNFQGWTGAGTNMINPAATPLAVVQVDMTGNAAGFYWQFTLGLGGLPGGGVSVPDGDGGIALQVAWVTDGFTPTTFQDLSAGMLNGCASATTRSNVFASNSGAPQGGNPATVGSTIPSYGRDISNAVMCPNIGQCIGNGGAPVGAGNDEHREIAATPARGFMVRLKGDVPPPPPPPATDLGNLADGTTTASGNVGSGAVTWYTFNLPVGAQDFDLKFFDMDTEGSTGDVAFALFNDVGTVVDLDNDSGAGTNDQMSFGVGRRASVGDGLQYDGRNGQLNAGVYYVAIGPAGSTFGGGFTASGSANPGGDFTLNLTTNVNAGALDPSVAPINAYDYDAIGGPIGFPDARQGLNANTGLRGVLWNRFSLTGEAGSGDSFLDIDFALTSTPTADAVAYIFDSTGELVAFSDDEGVNALPMFSFGVGDGNPRFYGANPEPYSGQTPGTLPAGEYYVAMALFATQDISLLGGNDRWHVRGTSGSNLTVTGDIYTGGTPGGGAGCDADVNCDGSPDQGDVACMILAVAGDTSCICQDPDFNLDGSADQGDVAAIILVVAGAPCP